MRIGGTGNVGINTTSPETTLDVNGTARIGTSSANNVHLNTTPGTGQRSIWMTYSGTGLSSDYGVLQVEHQGTSYRNLALNPYGANVGIGTSSPLAPLHINATAAGGIFRITGISVNGYMFVNSTGALGFNNNTSNTWSISAGGDIYSNSLTTGGSISCNGALYLNNTNSATSSQLGYIVSGSSTITWSTTIQTLFDLGVSCQGTYMVNVVYNCQCPSFPSTIYINIYPSKSSIIPVYTYNDFFIATSTQQYGNFSFPYFFASSTSYLEPRIYTSGNTVSCNFQMTYTRIG